MNNQVKVIKTITELEDDVNALLQATSDMPNISNETRYKLKVALYSLIEANHSIQLDKE